MSVLCLGEVWLELNAATAPELTETFRAQTGGWGAGFCRQYAALGGQAALLAQLGADPFGRKLAAQLARDGVDCSLLCFTDAFPTPVVFTGADTALPYRAHTAGLALGPEQLEAAPFRGASAFCFSLMNMFVRLAGDLPTPQKAFFRNEVALLFAIVILVKSGEGFHIGKGNFKYLFLRSFAGTVGIFGNFYAVDHLAQSDASMLNKMSPFCVIVFSYFILKEKLTHWQVLAAAARETTHRDSGRVDARVFYQQVYHTAHPKGPDVQGSPCIGRQCICTEPKKLCQWAGILRSIVGLQCTCIEGHGCPARLYDLFSRPVFLLRFLFDINERRPAASGWHILEEIRGLFAPRFRGIGQQLFHLIRPHFLPGRGSFFVIAKEQDCRDLLRSLRTHQHHGKFQTSLLRFQTDIPDLPYGFAFWQILF